MDQSSLFSFASSTQPPPLSFLDKDEVGKTSSLECEKQYKINFICSCLAQHKIHTRLDLIDQFDHLIEAIRNNPKIFKTKRSQRSYFTLFTKAIEHYSKTIDFSIKIHEDDFERFQNAFNRSLSLPKKSIKERDDLSRVTSNYDRLKSSYRKLKETSQSIDRVIQSDEFSVCSHVILGAGDSGGTVWLEKYKTHHLKTKKRLSEGKLPDVLIIGETSGSWKHDYTLAQPHSLLERCTPANPSDYISEKYYQTNPYTNARHVYQSNQVNLAKTEAPLLQSTKVLRIEKKELHDQSWQSKDHAYRLIIQTTSGEKAIYTNEIEICTGLGPARKSIGGRLKVEGDLKKLSQFDPERKFTPIVDGNQFILSDSEEQAKESRTIVVYGGGGSAAASYRKGFFGTDIRTEGRPLTSEAQKNKVFWIAKSGFEAAGHGKLARHALTFSENRRERLTAELQAITQDPITNKLTLQFIETWSSHPFTIECDQLIYSIGQEDLALKDLCREFDSELSLSFDESGTPINVETSDQRVHLFGAAAMAIRPNEYVDATWKGLRNEHIGPDVGPGSMPPSRAQIREHTRKLGIPIDTVNVNMDNSRRLIQFLKEGGVSQKTAAAFTKEVLEKRLNSTSGFSFSVLENLLYKYQLQNKFKIRGHSQLYCFHLKLGEFDKEVP